MYAVGEKIIYGSSGVCVVAEICTPDFSREERGRKYYKLRPLYGSETIYAPVDTTAFMRRVISPEEANALIARIPELEAQMCDSHSITMLRQQYEAFFQGHDCEAYIRLIKGVHQKGSGGRKLGQTDQRYMKRAQDVLYGELAAALELRPDEMPDYIKKMLESEA